MIAENANHATPTPHAREKALHVGIDALARARGLEPIITGQDAQVDFQIAQLTRHMRRQVIVTVYVQIRQMQYGETIKRLRKMVECYPYALKHWTHRVACGTGV
jgi:hypothetical protein